MKLQATIFQYKFVESVPQQMKEGVLYISIPYSTAMHLCPCGCHSEVVTKIAPNRWSMTFDGESVSLYPSVGNWGFPCKSHYWLKNNKIIWAENWTMKKVRRNRENDKKKNNWFFNRKK